MAPDQAQAARQSASDVAQGAARLSLASNIFLVVVKLGAGLHSGALSVLAEGIQSLLDILASGMILWSVRASAAPPDRAHPWGHGKFENLASLFQMVLITGAIGGILWTAWGRWQNPEMPKVDWGIGAIVISMAVDVWLAWRIGKSVRETGSAALKAEVVHLRGDLFACGGVIIGLVSTQIFHEPRFDPAFAALMTVFAAMGAVHLFRDTLRPLLDETLPGEEEFQIRQVLENDVRILGFHRLRTRQAGSARLADVHILLDDDLSFRAAHRISEEVEDAIRAVLPNLDIIVHIEPWAEETAHQREFHD